MRHSWPPVSRRLTSTQTIVTAQGGTRRLVRDRTLLLLARTLRFARTKTDASSDGPRIADDSAATIGSIGLSTLRFRAPHRVVPVGIALPARALVEQGRWFRRRTRSCSLHNRLCVYGQKAGGRDHRTDDTAQHQHSTPPVRRGSDPSDESTAHSCRQSANLGMRPV